MKRFTSAGHAQRFLIRVQRDIPHFRPRRHLLHAQVDSAVDTTSLYKGHRYPVEIISHCVWLYHRFPLSLRRSKR
jgi:hypothetical protein